MIAINAPIAASRNARRAEKVSLLIMPVTAAIDVHKIKKAQSSNV
ncbi:hypothetical protein CEV34_4495 [Brucella pseudogrignonensis]|uniref:Uncharacterized protein n=1 Tax=Brucella pseudogrignonensis TaxID=419475 RepID=A0A256G4Y5_9HYPH|nr:hypothetical protein CEV34_4495 [Brucella pseudogrignonensis]